MDPGHPNWEPIAYPRGFPVIVPEMLDVAASQPETNDPQPEGKNT
jgi:hypothetical protein